MVAEKVFEDNLLALGEKGLVALETKERKYGAEQLFGLPATGKILNFSQALMES